MADSQHAPMMVADFESSDDVQHVTTGTGVRKRVAMVAVISAVLIAVGCMVGRGTEAGLRHTEPQGLEQKDIFLPPPLLPPPKGKPLNMGMPLTGLTHLTSGTWAGFAKFADRACVEDGGFVAVKEPSEARCAASCLQSSTCQFVAYCPAADTIKCLGEHKNLCTRYTTCNSIGNSYSGFKTYMKTPASATSAPAVAPYAPRASTGTWEGFVAFSHDVPVGTTLAWTNSAPCHAAAIATTQVGGVGQCAQKCRDEPSCNFVAFCNDNAAGGNCKNEQHKACVMYKSCDTLARNPEDPAAGAYIVYRKVDQTLAMQLPQTAR